MQYSELKLAMLISGGGSTMAAIGKSCESAELRGLVRPVVVISSRGDAQGADKARLLGIPVEIVPRRDFAKGKAGVDAYGKALLQILSRFQPDVVTLNGFLAQVSEEMIEKHEGNIFNQHPGPVPAFGGTGMFGSRVHAAVIVFNRLLQRKSPRTEVVAQRVAADYDQGAAVNLATVEILPSDTVDDLQQRVLPVEHKLQIELLKAVAHGTVQDVAGREPYVRPGEEAVLEIARKVAIALYPSS